MNQDLVAIALSARRRNMDLKRERDNLLSQLNAMRKSRDEWKAKAIARRVKLKRLRENKRRHGYSKQGATLRERYGYTKLSPEELEWLRKPSYETRYNRNHG